MQQREVRVYLLDALAASEQIVSIRDEVGAKRLREDRIVRAAVERHLITIGEALHKAAGLATRLRTVSRTCARSSASAIAWCTATSRSSGSASSRWSRATSTCWSGTFRRARTDGPPALAHPSKSPRTKRKTRPHGGRVSRAFGEGCCLQPLLK